MNESKWVTSEEAGKYFNMSPKTILKFARAGGIPFLKMGDQIIRFNLREVEESLRNPPSHHSLQGNGGQCDPLPIFVILDAMARLFGEAGDVERTTTLARASEILKMVNGDLLRGEEDTDDIYNLLRGINLEKWTSKLENSA